MCGHKCVKVVLTYSSFILSCVCVTTDGVCTSKPGFIEILHCLQIQVTKFRRFTQSSFYSTPEGSRFTWAELK
jgi:hypothetical protein